MVIKNEKNLVVSSTPLRISFVGGGTDFPKFYKKHGGSFISSTIDKETLNFYKKNFTKLVREGLDNLDELKRSENK